MNRTSQCKLEHPHGNNLQVNVKISSDFNLASRSCVKMARDSRAGLLTGRFFKQVRVI